LLIPVPAVFCVPARAARLDAQLAGVESKFAAAVAQSSSTGPITLAIMPFQAEEALAQKKVDTAVSELLSQKFIRDAKFRLLEQGSLDDIFREQKLDLSGAVDADTAVRVGKLAGTRLIVTGAITQVGRNYQVTARLADTENSETVSMALFELPAEVFDGEASRYLILVPETETVSIYAAGAGAVCSVAALAPETHFGLTGSPVSGDAALVQVGGGLKYFPSKRWLVDFSYLYSNVSSSDEGKMDQSRIDGTLSGDMVRFSLNRQLRLSEKLSIYAGAGVNYAKLSLDSTRPQTDSISGRYRYVTPAGEDTFRYFSPTVRFGLEWRPQERFGISLFGTYAFTKRAYSMPLLIRDTSTGAAETMTVWKVDFPQFVPELNLAWYF